MLVGVHYPTRTRAHFMQHDATQPNSRKQAYRHFLLILAGLHRMPLVLGLVFVNRRLEVQFLSPAPFSCIT